MKYTDVIVGVPDGHLHEDIWNAMIKSGLSPQKSPRGYIATTNIPELLLKIGRPTDIVDETYDGSCVGGYTGEEILENKMLRRPELKEKIQIIKKYPIKPTKLVAAVQTRFTLT